VPARVSKTSRLGAHAIAAFVILWSRLAFLSFLSLETSDDAGNMLRLFRPSVLQEISAPRSMKVGWKNRKAGAGIPTGVYRVEDETGFLPTR